MARKDLLLDTAGNLVIEEGDFVVLGYATHKAYSGSTERGI